MTAYIDVLWHFIEISAAYLLLGFLISGVIHIFLPKEKIKQWLGRGGIEDVLKASAVGVPLPLCSCSVIPVASSLRKAGASNGATSSFLISTPESGIDSIAMSYGVLDGPMAVFRPIAAFSSAVVAGGLNQVFNNHQYLEETEKKACCHNEGDHSHGKPPGSLQQILKFGFQDLLDDMINWLLVGILLGSLISFFVPDNFFLQYNGAVNRLLILVVGIPIYICASASTPIAASLILKGLSPGTALLFLLVGPATNVSNIAVLQKYIGFKGVILNLIAIISVALFFSYGVDAFYESYPLNLRFQGGSDHEHSTWYDKLLGVILVIVLLRSFVRVNLKK